MKAVKYLFLTSLLLLVACSARMAPKSQDFSGITSVKIETVLSPAVGDKRGPESFVKLLGEELESKGYRVCMADSCSGQVTAKILFKEYSYSGTGESAESSIDLDFDVVDRSGAVFYKYPLDYTRSWPEIRHRQHLVSHLGAHFPFVAAKVLVLPVRDVVQGGQFHTKGAGSGRIVTNSLVTNLAGGRLTPVTTSNPVFNHRQVATPAQARSEAVKLGATYYMQTILGEFRNAAPMTFRTDFITLESCAMYRADDGRIVWQSPVPLLYSGTNIGSHLGYLEDMGERISTILERGKSNHVRGEKLLLPRESFPNNEQNSWVYSSPFTSYMDLNESSVIGTEVPLQMVKNSAKEEVAAVMTTKKQDSATGKNCSAEQIFTMQEAGLSKDQIRNACS